MEENVRETSYEQAAEELGKKLIALYNQKIFPRLGKIFADMLFQSGTEAGAYITSLGDIDELPVKRDMAQNAMIKLKRAAYVLNIMKSAGYYTPVQVVELEEYIQSLLVAVKNVLAIAYSQTSEAPRVAAPRPAQPVQPRQPVVYQTVVSVPKPTAQGTAAAAPAANDQPEEYFDSDGFNDIVE